MGATPVIAVFPKFAVTVELFEILIPKDAVGLVIVVEPLVNVPVTEFKRKTPLVAPAGALVEEILAKLVATAPILKSTVAPVPFKVISETVNVPKFMPAIS